MDFIKGLTNRLRDNKWGKLFLNKKFAHYTWIGIFISLLNIFLLWLMIDVLHIKTIIASSSVVAFTFIIRYVLFDSYRVL